MSQKPKRGTVEREEYKEKIKYLLRTKREEKGYSKVKLCKEILDIPVSTYNTYEYHGSLPRDPEMVRKIADALDIPITELLPDVETQPKESRHARQLSNHLSNEVFEQLNPLFLRLEELSDKYNEIHGNNGDTKETAFDTWLTYIPYFLIADLVNVGVERSRKIVSAIIKHMEREMEVPWEDKQEDTET